MILRRIKGCLSVLCLLLVTTSTRSSSDPLGRAAPILNPRRYFIMRWVTDASLLITSSDYELMA